MAKGKQASKDEAPKSLVTNRYKIMPYRPSDEERADMAIIRAFHGLRFDSHAIKLALSQESARIARLQLHNSK